jgi:hypothetical protein
MAAKTIVTLHPDVECGVCGRRLLRGERPDVFLGGGQRHMVCELCTPRAAHEGWRREIEGQGSIALGQRPPRGRSLLGRLRQLREPTRVSDPATAETGLVEDVDPLGSQPPRRAHARERAAEWTSIEPEWTSLDEEWAEIGRQPTRADASTAAVAGTPAEQGAQPASAESVSAEPAAVSPRGMPEGDREVRLALEIFNGSETPRRIAGIARALGEARVHVCRVADRAGAVAIVVAWELCWYRYEIDLDGEPGEVRIAAEGMELEELPAEERIANTAADEHGMLSPLAA